MSDTPKCSRKQSDMTPCVVEDGDDARADDGVCVGCGVSVPAPAVSAASEPPELVRAAARALLDEYDQARDSATQHPEDADARRVLRVIRNTVLSVLQGAAGHQPNGSELETNPK